MTDNDRFEELAQADDKTKDNDNVQTLETRATDSGEDKNNKILNLPNKLTLLRLVLIPVFIVFFFVPFTGHYLVALAIFIIAGVTDFLDGYFARKYGLVTNLGKFLDPVADKVLVITALVCMLVDENLFTGYIQEPWILTVAACCVCVIIARELIVSGFRMVASDTGIVIAADKLGKYKTTCQDIAICVLIGYIGIETIVGSNVYLMALYYLGLATFAIATVLTVISGINYIVKNVEVLKR